VCNENGLGHEAAGEVIEVGEGVTEWAKGDRVAIEAGIPCSKPSCEFCRSGRYNACPDVSDCGGPTEPQIR
jgi:L-iditol 2-dehydrogenase